MYLQNLFVLEKNFCFDAKKKKKKKKEKKKKNKGKRKKRSNSNDCIPFIFAFFCSLGHFPSYTNINKFNLSSLCYSFCNDLNAFYFV